MAWTAEQQEAIDREGTNIIVSAGAGSGKTAVLTARVQRKLKAGVHVNELLVLTFTNAAAAEMKDRIRDTINSTPGLEEEANLIDGAYITTFDSFSLSMVKKYHDRLNVTNKIKISDEVVIDIKKHELLDEIFDEYYDKGIINRIYTTNLTYVDDVIKKRKWFSEVDCSLYIAEIIDRLSNHQSISDIINKKEIVKIRKRTL